MVLELYLNALPTYAGTIFCFWMKFFGKQTIMYGRYILTLSRTHNFLQYGLGVPNAVPTRSEGFPQTGYFIPMRNGLGVWPDGRLVGTSSSLSLRPLPCPAQEMWTVRSVCRVTISGPQYRPTLGKFAEM